LFTSLSLLNSADVNISTLEDPVEYEIPGVNQTQVNPDIGLTFASGLRTLLRQDPDILMVGEIRDKETAELAVHSSLTGHLVLSTIHTNDAIGTIPRLVDMGIDPFLLTATVRLLVAQRLVSRLCQNCKQEVELTASMKEKIKAELEGVPAEYLTEPNQKDPQVLFESPGCPVCHEMGSVGRLAIFEVIPVTRELRALMTESTEYDTLHDMARRQKNLTMRQDGVLKALRGFIHYEDVVRTTEETENII
jgi:type II secretory ATPase GspE/PulE/Tfp pilus assembly ATPase PilB-like protein